MALYTEYSYKIRKIKSRIGIHIGGVNSYKAKITLHIGSALQRFVHIGDNKGDDRITHRWRIIQRLIFRGTVNGAICENCP